MKKDLLETQMRLEDAKMRHEMIQIQVKESFYKISAHKFPSDEEIIQEKKKYDTPKADTTANLSSIKERQNSAQHRLNQQKKALENLSYKGCI